MNRQSIPAQDFGKRAPFVLALEDLAQPVSTLADDLRLFATTWLGGVLFFGTLIA